MIQAQPKSTAGAAPAMGAFEQLEATLRLMVSEHERLLVLTGEHKAAIGAADMRRLGVCIGKQNEVVQRIAALERQRQGIVGAIVRMPAVQGPARLSQEQPTFSGVAAQAPEPVRSRLTSVAAALREILHRLHGEHMAVRSAAETLSSHMEGLVRQVCQRMSHAGTYGRGGLAGGGGRGGGEGGSAGDVRS
ncbi:MAG TPA: flagellar export chaperone FlgN [Phycisphaerales bacterium]|nr:flagellar export chaperone FlgN [Phycisphaerales bacterium]